MFAPATITQTVTYKSGRKLEPGDTVQVSVADAAWTLRYIGTPLAHTHLRCEMEGFTYVSIPRNAISLDSLKEVAATQS